MATASTPLANVDTRSFFEKVLRFAIDHELITPASLRSTLADGPKGIVQIANFFGTAHLRTDLENARQRMVNLISLYLEDLSGGDLQRAALSLRDKSLLSHSKGGADMIKRLHAMPDTRIIGAHAVSAEDQRHFLNDHSLSSVMSLADYRSALAYRQGCQREIDFALWLAKKMAVPGAQIKLSPDTVSIFRSAMLVVFVDKAPLQIPGRSGFVRLIGAARKKAAKLNEARLEALLDDAPMDYQALGRQEMARFLEKDLPEIRQVARTADSLLYGESSLPFFIVENIDDDNREYERLVAKEWHRVTRGEGDDPAVVSTVFLLLATGLPAQSKILRREAQDMIRVFRAGGFNSQAVTGFIDAHAPRELRVDLQRQWLDDLMPEAEVNLADSDPNWPDTYMERALEYVRKTCCATWKGRRR